MVVVVVLVVTVVLEERLDRDDVEAIEEVETTLLVARTVLLEELLEVVCASLAMYLSHIRSFGSGESASSTAKPGRWRFGGRTTYGWEHR